MAKGKTNGEVSSKNDNKSNEANSTREVKSMSLGYHTVTEVNDLVNACSSKVNEISQPEKKPESYNTYREDEIWALLDGSYDQRNYQSVKPAKKEKNLFLNLKSAYKKEAENQKTSKAEIFESLDLKIISI
jgi:hypothetical protein